MGRGVDCSWGTRPNSAAVCYTPRHNKRREGNPIAPPRKIKNAEELREKIREFIALVDSGEIDKPTDYRLHEYLGISADTQERWINERDKYQGYAEELKKLEKYREHYWLCKADDPKQTTFAIFNLKQRKNGGYTDKQEVEHKDMKIDLTINGVKGDAFG